MGGKKVEATLFKGIITSLLYLTTSRPDIMFSVCMCTHFQSNPKKSHLIVVKKIPRQLIGAPNLGLWYLRSYSNYLYGYTDVDYISSKIDRKNTNGACHFLKHCLMSCHNKKNRIV